MSMAKQGAKAGLPSLRFPEFRKANSWQGGALGEYATVVAGQSPEGAYYNETGEGLPFYQGKSDFGEIFLERPRKWTSQVTKRAEAGDIVMSVRAPVGALNVTTEDICIGRGLAAIQAKGPKWFLYYLLNSVSSSIIGNGGSVFDSINKDQIEKLRLFAPRDAAEQQKIADCLTSLDQVIAAQGRKVEALKAHKRGLMQQLFPREGETRPRLRFPEFRGAPEWDATSVGAWSKSFSGGTPPTTRADYYGGEIPFIRSAEIGSAKTELSLTQTGLKASSAKLVDAGDVLLALYGANSGDVALAKTPGAINQAILCIRPNGSKAFLYHYLTAIQPWLVATFLQGGQGNLSGEIVKSVGIRVPSSEEQQRIADCLASLDSQITAESHQLAALKTHKQGLMQQLFPAPAAAQA